jgi:hypothetical protein
MKKQKNAFKTIFRILGIGFLMFGFLMILILFMDKSPVIWSNVLPPLIVIPMIGIILLYATRNRSPKVLSKTDPGKIILQEKSPRGMETSVFMYKPNDIICMAVVYEGYLPQGHLLDNISLAKEIIDTAHLQGLPKDIKLCPETVIKIQRVNEIAFYQGDYEPKDDLLPMTDTCYQIAREKYLINYYLGMKLNVKNMGFKTWSTLVSNVWVQINVMQSVLTTNE